MASIMTPVADGQVFLEGGVGGLIGLGVGSGKRSAAVMLTPDEARRIAKKLDQLAAMADAPLARKSTE